MSRVSSISDGPTWLFSIAILRDHSGRLSFLFESNPVVADTGVRWPIFQAPMGWIARSPLVSAVAEAGALGIMETSSREFDAIRSEMARMRELTSRPWAVNLPLSFLRRGDSIVEDILDAGIRFVTTSAGHPARYTDRLKQAGITVYHAVPNVEAALRAEDAGVDGLIVEGAESAAFRSPREVHTMTLVPAVRRRTRLPIVAAGGIADGTGMAAAFALGADGVQLGTRFLCSAESPVHADYKAAVTAAGLFDTTVVNRGIGPCVRALRAALTQALGDGAASFAEALRATPTMYFNGDITGGLASAGESSALIDEVLPCAKIVTDLVDQFTAAIERLGRT
ncbi:NAD(P)H-dependent flavin oxidoreductase [[Mycobacterium] vasticus]|uniref:Nitronate monooxygenase n=1 Tax=[Mycobacterium] vasticus TaxID=2875777 RepID=A0ABU5Z6Y9_9MYCO|nr:nitronate monooxygenase [Mycolicibacter sp. MYC017]MEB3071713.1 nitronate monooxygenase [Mycolicibacter sp. MYC017]